jgi:hypothetical protein
MDLPSQYVLINISVLTYMSYSHIIETYVLSSPSWKTQRQFVCVHCCEILERLSSLIEGTVSKNSSI